MTSSAVLLLGRASPDLIYCRRDTDSLTSERILKLQLSMSGAGPLPRMGGDPTGPPDEDSGRAPRRPDAHEAELAEKLRVAAFVFEREKDGRFTGPILACHAVVEFIRRRGGGAELAAPFVAIAAAFRDLRRGGNPGLFSKKTAREKERERSPERRRIHTLAAAALAVLVTRGVERALAADKVARHVNKWRGMRAQKVTGSTVIAWRQ